MTFFRNLIYMSFDPKNLDDFEELSERELKVGYWFTTHRVKIYQGLLIALLIFDVVLGGYNIFKWGHYFAVGYWADQKMAREIAQPLIDYSHLRERLGAKPLIVGETHLFPGTTKADAVALVQNPNERFFVSFDYAFDLGGFKTAARRGFLLPGEEKPLAELGLDGAAAVSGAVLELKNLAWQRISAHKIANLTEYLAERLNFSVSEVNFTPAGLGALRHSRLTFKILNGSNFNYYEPRFLVLLKSGGTLVGLEQAVFDQFLAGEEKSVDLRLFGQNISPANIRVAPDINIFDSSAYFK